MTRLSAALLATLALATPALSEPAQIDASATIDAGRAAVASFADQMDTDRDRHIDRAEMQDAGARIFASMDVDGDGALGRAEYTGWEYGLLDMATFRGRDQAYRATMGMAFDLMDRDRSGRVDAAERAKALDTAFPLADRDGDGVLSMTEFGEDFFVSAAIRNGMTK